MKDLHCTFINQWSLPLGYHQEWDLLRVEYVRYTPTQCGGCFRFLVLGVGFHIQFLWY